MNEIENHSTGPRTEEGKLRSSLNAIKHGIFARSILMPGERQEDLDKLLYHYKRDYLPKGAPEEDLVRTLAETEWRRRRIPELEARAFEKALETGDTEHKFLNTYSIYEQRLNRTFQLTLKNLKDAQAKRLHDNGLAFRMAIILYRGHKDTGIPWNPADDGFVYSYDQIARQYDQFLRFYDANKLGKVTATDPELDEFFARDIQ